MSKQKGFTLIELVIVVAIIAILAAVALPAYDDHVRKTRRTQAKADMMELAQMLEREFTLSRSYADFTTTITTSPFTGTAYYNLAINPQTATTFTITASPIGTQTKDNAKCGTLSLNQLGTKTASGSLGVAGCW